MTFNDLAGLIRSGHARCGAVRLVAVDGPGGAGKSVFAEHVARALGGVPIVHTDDFASWDRPHQWWPRLEEQVLEPLERGETMRFQKYDWERRELGDWVTLPDSDLVVVEGVSSSRAAARDRLTMAIWIETARDERLRRGLDRDGASARRLWDQWMAEEDAFFERDRTRERADLVVDGSPTLMHDPEEQFVKV
jgi:uridine kinase